MNLSAEDRTMSIHFLRVGSKVSAINTMDGPVFGTFTVVHIGAAVSGPGYWVTVTGIPEGESGERKLSGYVYGISEEEYFGGTMEEILP